MQSVGKKMTIGLTLPIVALAAAAIKTSIDLELAFTGITKTVDGTEAQMASLRKELERLATSGESPVAALAGGQKALFEIAEAAGQLGVGIDDIAEFTDVMGQLALSTNIIGAEGATQLARFANVAGTSLSDIRNLGDVIVDLGNNMATTESEILTFGQRMGTLGNIGFQPEQILAFGAAMSSLGVRAQAGSTAFVKAAQGMQILAEKNNLAFRDMASQVGLTVDGFKELIENNPAEAMAVFAESLGNLSLEDQSIALKNLGAGGSRARQAFQALAGNTDLLRDSLNLASVAIEGNGALLNEAQKFAATTAGQMQILRNNITQLAADLGDVLLPAFNTIVQKLISLVQWFTNLSDGAKKAIVIIAGIVAVIGPLISIIGTIITVVGALGTAFTFASSAISAFTFAMSGFGVAAAIATAPIWLIIAAVAALAVGIGLLVLAYKKNFLGFKTFADGFINTWKTMLSRAKTAVSQMVQIFVKVGIAIAEGLWEGFKAGGKKLLIKLLGWTLDLINKVRGAFGISSPSAVMHEVGQNMAAGLQQGLIPGLQQVGNEASQTLNTMASTFRTQAQNMRQQFLAQTAGRGLGAQFRAMGGRTTAQGRRTQVQQRIAAQGQRALEEQGTRFRRPSVATRNTQVRTFQQQLTSGSRTGAANRTMQQNSQNSLRLQRELEARQARIANENQLANLFVPGERGSGSINIRNQTINVPPGTTREQVDILMTEMGKRVNRRGASGVS